jgi:MFS transporter, NNP family, nitrate/nitrite transporter
MTNATALYLRDEFGQSTASAAAIAFSFGFMNIFARGLGGFGSDLFNAKYGMRGRILWQTLNLLLEGVAIIIFGYSQTLAGSVVALIFLSLMVQSSEGSTFGIVPYVDRRYTGR